jgi:chondroitin AC lyase
MTFAHSTLTAAVAAACFSGAVFAQTASTPLKSLTVFSMVSSSADVPAAQWTLIRERMAAPLREGVAAGAYQKASFGLAAITSLRAAMKADGTWPDINYRDTASSNWDPLQHMARLHDMVLCYTTPQNDLYRNESLKKDILKAFHAWLNRSPESHNWFANQIHVPQKFANILLLLKTDTTLTRVLSASERDAALGIVKKAHIARAINLGLNTGANRLERASITLRRAAVEEDDALARESVGAISDVIRIVGPGKEGIQADRSFHQHGSQFYMAGYGLSMWKILDLMEWLQGTSLALSQDRLKVLTDFMLDGYVGLTRGKMIHPAGAGRGVTGPYGISTQGLLAPLNQLIELNPNYRRQELIAYQQELSAVWKGQPFVKKEDANYYYASDAASYHASQLSVFIKTSSPSTRQPETGNSAGLKNLHLADGTHFFVKKGDEYLNTQPFLNWRNLPGTTTAINSTYSLKPAFDWGVPGTAVHVGGAANGAQLLSFMDYSRNSVKEKKTWVAMDGQIIYLGANVAAPASVGQIVSNVNQVPSTGQVVYNDGVSSFNLGSGSKVSSGISWVWHDGLVYHFPVPVDLSVGSRAVSGAWSEINANASDTVAVKNMFNLAVNHGVSPQGRNFHYVVKSAETPDLVKPLDAKALVVSRNDASAQVVRYEPAGGHQTVSGVFWAARAVAENISTSAPVGLILDKDLNNRRITLTLAPISKDDGPLVKVTLGKLNAMNLVSADASIQVNSLGETTQLTFDPSDRNGKPATVRFSF